ncbi:MAG: lysophospholipid acyltransferase (LPLAT)-like uncharacterized protein [Woeseiaceae bacterium]
MTEQRSKPDYSDVEARRKTTSRQLTPLRRLYNFLVTRLYGGIYALACKTYRVEKIIGSEIAERILADTSKIYAPCYWHQQHVLCSKMMLTWIKRGFRACFIVSASVDGEIPARVARSWGAEVIRGSANQAGALAMRDIQQMMKGGYSIVTTADGSNGPIYEFKSGTVLMARIGNVPMVPMACAAEKAWYLNRWDKFMIPKPFSRVVLAVGEPIVVPRGTPPDALEEYRMQMQYATNALMAESKLELEKQSVS